MRVKIKDFWGLQIILISLTVFLGACAPKGFNRTPFKNWSYKEFHNLGFKVELPEKTQKVASRYYEKVYESESFQSETGGKLVYIWMHPIWHGSWFTEPFYILKFDFIRLSKEKFEVFKQGKHYLSGHFKYDPNYKEFVSEVRKIQIDAPYANPPGTYLKFRKDVIMTNGDVVIIGAELLTSYSDYTSEMQTEDIPAILRILNSVKAID
jgi:hypothetical protein